jgi:adenylate kinase
LPCFSIFCTSIGTLLELARCIAIRLAEQNLRVRVCVQGSMGVGIFTGLPKQLSGVATILQRMDWQSEEGEVNEGMVGDYVNFGAIGKNHVVNAHVDASGKQVAQDDVFLLLCPQSSIGLESCIIGPLQEMTEAAGDRPVILINADLTDKVSSQGQQSVRGRKERLEFADSFQTIFHFSNLYMSGTSYFPILGSMTKLKPSQPWVAHQRRERLNGEGEVYVPVVSSEEKPEGDSMKRCFEL